MMIESNHDKKSVERRMKDCMLLDFYEHDLKSLRSYVDALEKIQNIDVLEHYLRNHVLPVVADWPGQIFTRKAISLYLLSRLMLAIHVIFLLPNCYGITAPTFENHVINKH